MTADDKRKVRQRILTDFFVRYGSGAHHVEKFTSWRRWNWIAWLLIIVGTAGWVVFLLWNP